MSHTGHDLIAWGVESGKGFASLLTIANALADMGHREEFVKEFVLSCVREVKLLLLRPREVPISLAGDHTLRATNEEAANHRDVITAMNTVMGMPTVTGGALLPDACPAGPAPVGSVVQTDSTIHPGYHSSDMACSMYMTYLSYQGDEKDVLDAAEMVTHFGPGKRLEAISGVKDRLDSLIHNFCGNRFLDGLEYKALEQIGTQGDGNHFLSVGRSRDSGAAAITTHHGSRGLGAAVYKRGALAARKHTSGVATGIPKGHEWLDLGSDIGREYLLAINIVEAWTLLNHEVIHEEIAKRLGCEMVHDIFTLHNTVFFGQNNAVFHAKGATPCRDGDIAIIPMSMSDDIYIVKGCGAESSLSFAPHGAGRNMSRTKFKGVYGDTVERPGRIDFRWFSGEEDVSELPDAYKSGKDVIEASLAAGLFTIHDKIAPYGCIMAGYIKWNKPGKNKGKKS